MDTREGEDLTLKCRFSEQHLPNDFSYYWARVSGTNYENVAIGQVQLSQNYRYVFDKNNLHDILGYPPPLILEANISASFDPCQFRQFLCPNLHDKSPTQMDDSAMEKKERSTFANPLNRGP